MNRKLSAPIRIAAQGFAAALLLIPSLLGAQAAREANAAALARHTNADKKKIALQGYSPVSYFESGKAEKGDPAYSADLNGATYFFTSKAQADAFKKEPAKYEPAYGGWCATAIAYGKKVEIDPSNFKIAGGKLLLFYKGLRGDALKDWNKAEPELTRKADAAWAKILEK